MSFDYNQNSFETFLNEVVFVKKKSEAASPNEITAGNANSSPSKAPKTIVKVKSFFNSLKKNKTSEDIFAEDDDRSEFEAACSSSAKGGKSFRM